jgi:hypothetical protein
MLGSVAGVYELGAWMARTWVGPYHAGQAWPWYAAAGLCLVATTLAALTGRRLAGPLDSWRRGSRRTFGAQCMYVTGAATVVMLAAGLVAQRLARRMVRRRLPVWTRGAAERHGLSPASADELAAMIELTAPVTPWRDGAVVVEEALLDSREPGVGRSGHRLG